MSLMATSIRHSVVLTAASALLLAACGDPQPAAADGCQRVNAPEPRGTCPTTVLLDAACTCDADIFEPSLGGQWACTLDGLVRKTPLPAAEQCNGLDDNGDGTVDDGAACAALCSASALAVAEGALHLPTSQDVTTGDGSAGALNQLTDVPAWCEHPEKPAPGEDVLWVGCGEILTLTHGVKVGSLRVAPGGVVLATADALIEAPELWVCPNGLVQSGPGPGGTAGASLQVHAGTWLHYGALRTAGGDIDAQIERALIAGLVSTQGKVGIDGHTPSEIDGSDSGNAHIHVTTESFISGTIRTAGGDGGAQLGCGPGGEAGAAGALSFSVPACCQGGALDFGGGDGGDGGVLEDDHEGSVVNLERGQTVSGALCNGEDEFRVAVTCPLRLTLAFDPDAAEDLDLVAVDSSGATVAASLGVTSKEQIVLTTPGDYRVFVRAFGPASNIGPYTLAAE